MYTSLYISKLLNSSSIYNEYVDRKMCMDNVRHFSNMNDCLSKFGLHLQSVHQACIVNMGVR